MMQNTSAVPLRGDNLLGTLTSSGVEDWYFVRAQLSSEAIIGPGGVVARKLIEESSWGTHDFRRVVHKEDTHEDYVLSFMAKPQERSLVQVWMGSTTHAERAQVSFDIIGGRITNTSTVGKGWKTLGADALCLEDGWWWCWMAIRSDAGTRLSILIALEEANSSVFYNGDSASGAWFGNLRLEKGRIPTLVLPAIGPASAASVEARLDQETAAVKRIDTRALTTSEAITKLKGPALSEIKLIHHKLVFDNETAADKFYVGRLEMDNPLAYYERQLLNAIDKLPPAHAYHEIGGGIGLLPIALGLTGRKAVNIDNTTSRVAHGSNILSSLAKDDPTLIERVQMLCASVPDVFESLDTTGVCAISTNLGAPRSPDFVKSFLRAVQDNYASFIFDLCLLWGVYREPREWQAHLDLVTAIWGGKKPELLFETDGPGRYYIVRFTNQSVI